MIFIHAALSFFSCSSGMLETSLPTVSWLLGSRRDTVLAVNDCVFKMMSRHLGLRRLKVRVMVFGFFLLGVLFLGFFFFPELWRV